MVRRILIIFFLLSLPCSHCLVKACPKRTLFVAVVCNLLEKSWRGMFKSRRPLFSDLPLRRRCPASCQCVIILAHPSGYILQTWAAQSHFSLADFLPTPMIPVLERIVLFLTRSVIRCALLIHIYILYNTQIILSTLVAKIISKLTVHVTSVPNVA